MREIIGVRDDRALATLFASLDGVGLGFAAEPADSDPMIYPYESWLGRVLNAFAEPADGKGVLLQGDTGYGVRNPPPSAHSRNHVEGKTDLGIRTVNTKLTCCRG